MDRLSKLESQEANLEHECKQIGNSTNTVNTIDHRLAEMQELQEIERIEEEAGIKGQTPTIEAPDSLASSFLSESVYGKLNSPQARKRRAMRSFLNKLADVRTYSNAGSAETSCSWNEYSSMDSHDGAYLDITSS